MALSSSVTLILPLVVMSRSGVTTLNIAETRFAGPSKPVREVML